MNYCESYDCNVKSTKSLHVYIFFFNVDIRYCGNFSCRKTEFKMPFPECQKGQPNDLL